MEIVDVYDIHKNKLNKTIVRGHSEDLQEGEYVRAVSIWIKSGIRFLVQKVSKEKGSWWAATSGALSTGNESLDQAVIECKEELNLDVKKVQLQYVGDLIFNDVIIDVYLYDSDEDLEAVELTLQESEVEKVAWLSANEIEDMILKGELRQSSCESFLKYIKKYV
ncbi:MAG: NUDIX domain-containing protein [Clostridia bacterium]|nr:NUDIX domain-containing protein [Clostridia bacterium]